MNNEQEKKNQEEIEIIKEEGNDNAKYLKSKSNPLKAIMILSLCVILITFLLTSYEKKDYDFEFSNTVDTIRPEQKIVRIDTVKIKELEKFFTKQKDEFSDNELIRYEPKVAPKYTNMNGLYCYFSTQHGIPTNLSFRFQYFAENWLFVDKIKFSIDEKSFEFIPIKTERDNGGGYVWEWFDEDLKEENKELIYALSNAKKAKMKIIGRQYYEIRDISQTEIMSIKQTLELFAAIGGTY